MRTTSLALLISALVSVSGCNSGGSAAAPGASSTSNGQSVATGITYNLTGHIQKGPFVQGASITLQELDNSLTPTGMSYSTQTTDSAGSFAISSNLTSSFVEIIATGYYFNEVSGSLSESTLTLRAYADLSANPNVNVNILTSLSHDRIQALFAGGNSFAQAQTQAENEVLTVFDIPGDGIGDFEQLDISQSGNGNAALLAVSAILQGQNSVAQLSELLAELASDIATNGAITNSTNLAEIASNSMALNLASVRANLSTWYSSLGIAVTIPDFENFVDSQGTGAINGGLPTTAVISGASNVVEGLTATVNVSLVGALTDQPVTITITSSDPTRVTVSPSSLTFTQSSFYIPQPVTLSGSNSGLASATITLSASGSAAVTGTDSISFVHYPHLIQVPVTAPGAGNMSFQGLALDANGNLYTKVILETASTTTQNLIELSSNGVQSGVNIANFPTSYLAPNNSVEIRAIDSSGNFYMVEDGGSGPGDTQITIQKVNSSGATTNTSMVDNANYSGTYIEQNIAVDSQGNIYVPMYAGIIKITPTGSSSVFVGNASPNGNNSGDADGIGAAATFAGPTNIAIDSSDNLYVVDAINFNIRKVTPGGVVTHFAGPNTGTYSSRSGYLDGTGTNARFNFEGISGIAVDILGNLYVTDFTTLEGATSSIIRKITPEEVVTTYCGGNFPTSNMNDGSCGFNSVGNLQGDIAVDPFGNVFVNSYMPNGSGGNVILKLTP